MRGKLAGDRKHTAFFQLQIVICSGHVSGERDCY